MALFTWQKKKTDDGTETIDFPDELAGQIKKGAEAADKLTRIEQLLADQASTQQKRDADEKKARDEAATAAARRKQEETSGTIEEQVEALMLEGRTKEAIALATQGQSAAIMSVRADQIKREVFDDAEKFPFYSGDIKREIDSLLEKQPLAFRNNPVNVENCYHTILGKHTPELLEGKLKNRFGGSSAKAGSGNAGDTGTGADDKNKTIPDDVKKAAKLMGFKPEEYAKMLDEEGVAYV